MVKNCRWLEELKAVCTPYNHMRRGEADSSLPEPPNENPGLVDTLAEDPAKQCLGLLTQRTMK